MSHVSYVVWVCVIFTVAPAKSDDETKKCAKQFIPGCSCVFLEEIWGIICTNETDIVLFPNKLDSIFGLNATYEITLQHLHTIPQYVIQGLIVFRLIIDDPTTVEISEWAFTNVLRLRWFHVFLSSISEIPNFKPVQHSLRKVNIDNSLLTSVGIEFQNLSLMTRLSLRNNTIEYVDAEAFTGSINIHYLDLSYNRITHLPENLFDELKDIVKLTVSFNRFHTVQGLLKNLGSQLKFLNVEFNNLTDADDILHPGMTELETLYLNSNPLKTLSAKTFADKVPKLRFLYMGNCNLTEFRVEYFKNLSILATLDLGDNQIRHIGNETMDFGLNFDLALDGNPIETFAKCLTFRTKRLFLMDNKLKSLGEALQITQMTEVDISGNQLVALESYNFLGSHSTENLAFRSNKIESIDTSSFVEAFRNSIQTLDLSCNRLVSLNRSIQLLSQLKSLNVSFNLIEKLDDGEFQGLNELSELYIQNNRIVVLRGQIQSLPKLQYLILQNNSMNQLDIKQIPSALRYLSVKGNPLECNCRFYLNFLSKMKPGSATLDYSPCSPKTMPEKPPYEPCPAPCDCYCKSDINSSFVTVDCGSKFLTSVPGAVSNWSTYPGSDDGVYRIDNPNYIIFDHTLSLNLSHNRIESLNEVNFSWNLKELFLADNLLTLLPYSIMSLRRLRQVTLSDNRFTCDCDDGKAVNFREWLLSKNGYILDVNRTRCFKSNENKELVGKVIVSVSEADLCPSEIGMIISLTFAVLCILLLTAALKITYTRYEVNIKVWLYSKGFTFVKEKDIDRDKNFDAFLSFSHTDHDFVTDEIIDELEARCPNINLCIHYRHFLPGKFIHENIMEAVNRSKRTVLILSRNFLDSEWCMMEFRAADVQNIKDRVRRVIVVKVGDLPPDLDPSIKIYLDSTTYLTWGEKYFWQKFIYALPTPSAYVLHTQNGVTLTA